MAEAAIGLAASIAGLAAFGIQIVTTLNNFATTYSRAEQQIKDLSGNIALTSSILESIGKMIKEYEDKFQLTVDNYIATRDQCERNFSMLWRALKAVKKEESEKTPVRGELRIGGRLGIWAKMMHAMGGADSLKDLVLSIERSKSNLQLLLSSLSFLVLKSLGKNNLLTEDQSEDFKLFMSQLPALVVALRQAGLMKGGRKSVEKIENEIVTIAMHVGEVAVADSCPEATLNDSCGGNDSSSSSSDKGKKQEVTAISRDITGDTEDLLEDHLIGAESPNEIGLVQEPSDEEVIQKKGATPRNSIDIESIYEGWLLQSKPQEHELHGMMVFCGMKFSFYAGDSTTDYSVIPSSKDKEMLKKSASSSQTKQETAATKVNDDKHMIKHLPKEARREIVKLVNDRNKRPKIPYGWKIAAVVKQTPKSMFSFARRKAKNPLSWLVVLRGGVIESPSEDPPQTLSKDSSSLPRRHDNPWRHLSSDSGSSDLSEDESNNSSSDNSSDSSISFVRRRPQHNYRDVVEVRAEVFDPPQNRFAVGPTWVAGPPSGRHPPPGGRPIIVEAPERAEAFAKAMVEGEKKPPIKFKDAVGREFSFPFELCATWAGMRELIREAFSGFGGLSHLVVEGRYDLVGPNGEVILPQVWESTIEPGWSVSMHMRPMPVPPPLRFPPGPMPGHHSDSHRRPRSRHGWPPAPGPPPSQMRGAFQGCPAPPPGPPLTRWQNGPLGSSSGSKRKEQMEGTPNHRLTTGEDGGEENIASSQEEEMIDDEEAERLMDEFLETFTKDDAEMETAEGEGKDNSI